MNWLVQPCKGIVSAGRCGSFFLADVNRVLEQSFLRGCRRCLPSSLVLPFSSRQRSSSSDITIEADLFEEIAGFMVATNSPATFQKMMIAGEFTPALKIASSSTSWRSRLNWNHYLCFNNSWKAVEFTTAQVTLTELIKTMTWTVQSSVKIYCGLPVAYNVARKT